MATFDLTTAIQKFWEKVDKNGPIPPHRPELGQCWPWTGYKNHNNYGITTILSDGRRTLTHRVAWKIAHGPIPEDVKILHKCDYPPCCRESHLFSGSQDDNMKDMAEKRRSTWGEKHHAAVFTVELILEIRSRVAAGKHGIIAEIAREYKVTPTCIEKIAKRLRWKDI